MTNHWFTYLAMLSLALFVGCADSGSDYSEVSTGEADAAQAAADAEEDHHHDAPHGGYLVELGEHAYNIEFVFTAEPEAKLTAYILDAHAENAVATLAKEFIFHLEGDGDEHEIILKADPQESDKVGEASRFSASGEALPKGIKDIEDVAGHLHVSIGGKDFSGALEHEHDAHEGHDDDHGKHGKDHDDHADHKDGDKDHGKEHKDHDEDHKDGDKDHDKEHKDGDKDHKDGDKDADSKDEAKAETKDADK